MNTSALILIGVAIVGVIAYLFRPNRCSLCKRPVRMSSYGFHPRRCACQYATKPLRQS